MLGAGRIAIVGLSDDPSRPSFQIASYLRGAGYVIVPVNPTHQTVLGLKSYPSLRDVPQSLPCIRPSFLRCSAQRLRVRRSHQKES